PPELNPLAYEVVPMTVQTQNHKASINHAEPQSSTERRHCSFEQITPLSLSFTVKPDKAVTLYHATVDQKPVVLRMLN
ncbi:tyrosine-protein kinase STYK1-like, partial [Clarias magur]